MGRHTGGVAFVHPGCGPGNFIVDKTNIRDTRLAIGQIITSGIIAELVHEGATVVVVNQMGETSHGAR